MNGLGWSWLKIIDRILSVLTFLWALRFLLQGFEIIAPGEPVSYFTAAAGYYFTARWFWNDASRSRIEAKP